VIIKIASYPAPIGVHVVTAMQYLGGLLILVAGWWMAVTWYRNADAYTDPDRKSLGDDTHDFSPDEIRFFTAGIGAVCPSLSYWR
jgi:hypothetical protein